MVAFGWRNHFSTFLVSAGFLWSACVSTPFYRKSAGRTPERQSSGVGAHTRPATRTVSIKPSCRSEIAAGCAVENHFLVRPTCGTSRPATAVSFTGPIFFSPGFPTYLLEYRHLSIKSLGIVASLPLLGRNGRRHCRRIVNRQSVQENWKTQVCPPHRGLRRACWLPPACLIPAATSHAASNGKSSV